VSQQTGAPPDQERERLRAGLAAGTGLADGDVTVTDADGTACFDVPAGAWPAVVAYARDVWGCAFFDWLSAVDQPDAYPPGLDVVLHLARVGNPAEALGRVLLRTRAAAADGQAPTVHSITGLFPGAAWHERETHEMFGVEFEGFDDGSGLGMRPLLLPDGFRGTPLRKTFQLAARAAKPWPGAKEPGESHADAASPSRRKLLPPGVPDAATWGPRRPSPAVTSAEVTAPGGTSADAREGEPQDGDDGA
jgi:NADH-quinone oxidoreductase subunit C